MKRRFDRVLVILVAAVFVAAGWSIVSHTGWGATRDFLTAGPGYSRWWEPFVDLVVFGAIGWVISHGVARAHRRPRSVRGPTIRPERIGAPPAGVAGR